MVLTDIHTHTAFSPDGKDSLSDMVQRAEELGVQYYGISEHYDLDYVMNHLAIDESEKKLTDLNAYFTAARKLQKERRKEITLLVGCEFGFTPNRDVVPLYKEIIEKYSPDFIVNSVHTNRVSDYYYPVSFGAKIKAEAYKEYFDLVLRSTKADYDYDIVGHLGYCSRYAPYKDTKILYAEFKDEIDSILKEIIFREKILEVNTSADGSGSDFLPDKDILARYYDLGGRNISFSSDAHDVSHIMKKRDLVVDALKDIGFKGVTVPNKGKYVKVGFND